MRCDLGITQSAALQQVFAGAEERFVKNVSKNYLKKGSLGRIMKVSAR
jgi:hypothetical protein